jgi:hypothetical protein
VSYRFIYISISLVVWALLGLTLWGMISTLEFGCQLRERDSGLAAECIAPALLLFSGAFLLIFIIDIVRTVIALRRPKNDEGEA